MSDARWHRPPGCHRHYPSSTPASRHIRSQTKNQEQKARSAQGTFPLGRSLGSSPDDTRNSSSRRAFDRTQTSDQKQAPLLIFKPYLINPQVRTAQEAETVWPQHKSLRRKEAAWPKMRRFSAKESPISLYLLILQDKAPRFYVPCVYVGVWLAET